MTYAKHTTVPIDRTIGEIRKILTRYGCDGFGSIEQNNVACITFKMKNRTVKMFIKFPLAPKESATQATIKAYEQIKKSKWRSFLLCIKAKIESVESGIETFEESFLPHIVTSNGSTIGHKIINQIDLHPINQKFLIGPE